MSISLPHMRTDLFWFTWTETSPCPMALQANKEALDQFTLPMPPATGAKGDAQGGGIIQNWIIKEQHPHNPLVGPLCASAIYSLTQRALSKQNPELALSRDWGSCKMSNTWLLLSNSGAKCRNRVSGPTWCPSCSDGR